MQYVIKFVKILKLTKIILKKKQYFVEFCEIIKNDLKFTKIAKNQTFIIIIKINNL